LCKDCHKIKSIQERKEGMYNYNDEIVSSFNGMVWENIMNTIFVKSWQFVEIVDDNEYKNKFKVDMRKCRRNILFNSKYEFPVYSVMDIPKPFSGVVKCGMYFVETLNIFPFRGDGWYLEPLIVYGLENNLININDIKMEFTPSKTLKPTYFQENINTLLNAFECVPSLQKMSVNAYIGCMGKLKRTACFSKFSLDIYEASNWIANKNKDVFILTRKLESETILYEGIHSEEIISECTAYPVYSMILQMEAMELHKLENVIIENGGKILDRNTDAIRYTAKEEIDLFNEHWDDEKTILKYQQEEPKPLTTSKLQKFCRKNYVEKDAFNLNWNITYDYETTVEEKATEIINAKTSIHIDGKAGTGKTYLTNKIIEELKNKNIQYMAFAPTNKASRLIGGQTIDSLYNQFQHRKSKLFAMLKNVKYIIVDEISMMKEIFYRFFVLIKMSFPDILFILTGDYAQFKPVKDWWDGDYKNSPATFSLCGGNRLQLTKCRRSNKELFKLYTNVEAVDRNQFPIVEETFLNVSYKHTTRIRINKFRMNSFKQKHSNEKYVFIEKDTKNDKTQDVYLGRGMPIIAHTTNKKLNILNSEKFIIETINDKEIEISDENRKVKVDLKLFHKLFYLGFCITIHASQGETFKEKYTIYDWGFEHFCSRAKYVALSRASDLSNIQIA
jgi:DNA replication protein DnaC